MTDFRCHSESVPPDVVLVSVAGQMDFSVIGQFKHILQEMWNQNRYRIIFDLSQLRYLASQGVGLFVHALDQAQGNGGNVVILNPDPGVMETFHVLGITELFTFAYSREEALAVFL